jgi:hypothetical protein
LNLPAVLLGSYLDQQPWAGSNLQLGGPDGIRTRVPGSGGPCLVLAGPPAQKRVKKGKNKKEGFYFSGFFTSRAIRARMAPISST